MTRFTPSGAPVLFGWPLRPLRRKQDAADDEGRNDERGIDPAQLQTAIRMWFD
jgi:hypothetical protein